VTARFCRRNAPYWHTAICWCYVSSCASLDAIIIIGDLRITFTKCYTHDGHTAHLIRHLVQCDSLQCKNRYFIFHTWQLFPTLQAPTCSVGLYLIPICFVRLFVFSVTLLSAVELHCSKLLLICISFRAKHFNSNLSRRRRRRRRRRGRRRRRRRRRRICLLPECVVM
jgi:hypothetical protein